MKKRILISMLAASMVLALGACGKDDQTTEPSQDVESSVEDVIDTPADDILDMPADDSFDMPADDIVEGEDQKEFTGEKVSDIIKADFQTIMAENEDLTAEEIAAKLCENEKLVIGPEAMKVEEGLLPGFVNYEVKGFSDGAEFSPVIGSIPFVGYVFVVEEGGDVDAFINNLKENANLNWNICVSADEMAVDQVGNTVLFVMCPLSFEE